MGLFDLFKKKHNQKTHSTFKKNEDILKKDQQGTKNSINSFNDDLTTTPFVVYTQGVRAMNCMYIEVSVYARNGSFFYTVSGGSAHMDGFEVSDQIPLELLFDNCIVLGKLLSCINSKLNIISCNQTDNYLIVDFSKQIVCAPANATCAYCGSIIKDLPDSTHEPFCINGEIFCRECFRVNNWRQVIIKERPILEIGKRGEEYFYYAAECDNKDVDNCYSGQIPTSLLQNNEINIDGLVQHIAKSKDDYSVRPWRNIIAPYSFDVKTRKISSTKPFVCYDCGKPVVDTNLEVNCIDSFHSIFDADGNPYCNTCKICNNWAKPIYTVDLFGVKESLFDYTIHIGQFNKQYVCYVSTKYMSESINSEPIILPLTLIENNVISFNALLKYLKSTNELEYLPSSYCDNYYSFDFIKKEIAHPVPLKCSKCGILVLEHSIFNGILDCTDSICSVDNTPLCIDCFLNHTENSSYTFRNREKMVYLFKYDIPEREKWMHRRCDLIALYLDPQSGKIYMDYLKKNGTEEIIVIPLKQITIRAMLDKAKKCSLDVFEKYKDMTVDNWKDYI